MADESGHGHLLSRHAGDRAAAHPAKFRRGRRCLDRRDLDIYRPNRPQWAFIFFAADSNTEIVITANRKVATRCHLRRHKHRSTAVAPPSMVW